METKQRCTRRGYCGPFRDQEVFDAVPGWEGIGTCQVCGSTVDVERHERLRRERDRRSHRGASGRRVA